MYFFNFAIADRPCRMNAYSTCDTRVWRIFAINRVYGAINEKADEPDSE